MRSFIAMLRRKRQYRVKRVFGGFEPQMRYGCGAIQKAVWFPLTMQGYWAEPDAFSFGEVRSRHPLPTKAMARAAIERAKLINGPGLLTPAA